MKDIYFEDEGEQWRIDMDSLCYAVAATFGNTYTMNPALLVRARDGVIAFEHGSSLCPGDWNILYEDFSDEGYDMPDVPDADDYDDRDSYAKAMRDYEAEREESLEFWAQVIIDSYSLEDLLLLALPYSDENEGTP